MKRHLKLFLLFSLGLLLMVLLIQNPMTGGVRHASEDRARLSQVLEKRPEWSGVQVIVITDGSLVVRGRIGDDRSPIELVELVRASVRPSVPVDVQIENGEGAQFLCEIADGVVRRQELMQSAGETGGPEKGRAGKRGIPQ